MTKASDLSSKFRHIRILLARESGHPEGDPREGYDLLAPLGADGRLDAQEWKAHQEHCRVRRFSAARADRIGRLRRKPGGQWYFDYEEGDRDDEIGFHFGEERFVTGEYVSLSHGDHSHTYKVVRVEKP
jgi:hypothetical protein